MNNIPKTFIAVPYQNQTHIVRTCEAECAKPFCWKKIETQNTIKERKYLEVEPYKILSNLHNHVPDIYTTSRQ
jgi:hypothetical protein